MPFCGDFGGRNGKGQPCGVRVRDGLCKAHQEKPRFVKFGIIKKSKYIELLANGGRRVVSSKAVGVSYECVRLHMQKDEIFADRVSEAEIEANENVENALYQAAIGGNVIAMQVWLYNRAPDHWQDRRNVKHTDKMDPKEASERLARILGVKVEDLPE